MKVMIIQPDDQLNKTVSQYQHYFPVFSIIKSDGLFPTHLIEKMVF